MSTEPIVDESVIPPKPRRKDYVDKVLYNNDYNRWRTKYDLEYRNRESQRRYERRNDPVIVERYRQNRLKKYAENCESQKKRKSASRNTSYTVYEISNKISDYRYIGHTIQKLSERFRAHMHQSKIGNSNLHYFIKDLDKGVCINDIFSITPLIENIPTKDEALKLEGETILNMLSNNINLFNQVIPTGKRQKYTNNIVLYKILNTVTDDVYIGVTYQKLSDRFTAHKSAIFSSKSKSNLYFHKLAKEISDKNTFNTIFNIYPVIQHITDESTGFQMENEFITKLVSFGYNILNTNYVVKNNIEFDLELEKYCIPGEHNILTDRRGGLVWKDEVDLGLVAQLTEDGLSSYKIGKQLGISQGHVCSLRAKLGIKSIAKGSKQTKLTKELADDIERLLLEGKTKNQISKELGIGTTAICRLKNKLGITWADLIRIRKELGIRRIFPKGIKRKSKITPEMVCIIEQMTNERKSAKEISKVIGVSKSRIDEFRKTNNIRAQSNIRSFISTQFDDVTQYLEEGYSAKEIANKLNIHWSTVYNFIKKHKLTLPSG